MGLACGDPRGRSDGATGGSDPEATRRRATRVVVDLFTALAREAPIVVLFEDLHWADDATLDWLQELAASSSTAFPLLVVATARPALWDRRPHWGEGVEGHATIRLERLSRRESRHLLGEIFQRADGLPDTVRDELVAAADGNPFFIEELVKWLIEQEVVVVEAAAWHVRADRVTTLELPATLRGVLQARLDALPPGERDVLDRASVLGKVFWDDAVRRLGQAQPDEPATDDDASAAVAVALDRLRQHEVVFQRPTSQYDGALEYSFRHALMRDVTYTGLLRSHRRGLHALAAGWLQDVAAHTQRESEHAAAIAEHLEAAQQAAAAAGWYLRAGRHAAVAFANDGALELLGRGLRLVPDDHVEQRYDLLLEQEAVLHRLGRRDEQRAVLALLDDIEVDVGRQARAGIARSRWAFYQSDFVAAEMHGEQAAQLARSGGHTDVELDALVLVGRSIAWRNEHDAARTHLEEVLARAREAGSPSHVAAALQALGVVASNLGLSDRAPELLAEAGDVYAGIADREGEGMVRGQMGVILLATQRYQQAAVASREALEIFRATGHHLRQGIVLGNLAEIALEGGRLDEGLAWVREAHDLAVAVDDHEMHASALHDRGEHARLTGDLAGARELLDQAMVVARELDLPYYLAVVLGTMSLVALDAGDPAAAQAHADATLEAAERTDMPRYRARASAIAGLVRCQVGDPGGVALLTTAVGLSDELDRQVDRLEVAAALAATLLPSDPGRSIELVNEVLAALDRWREPGTIHPGQALLDCHAVLTATGDQRAALLPARAQRWLDHVASGIQDTAVRQRWAATRLNLDLAALAAA